MIIINVRLSDRPRLSTGRSTNNLMFVFVCFVLFCFVLFEIFFFFFFFFGGGGGGVCLFSLVVFSFNLPKFRIFNLSRTFLKTTSL